MSLSDLAAIGSFISGFAVLISLIFLYFQLRQIGKQVVQAERNQQAAIRQGRVARTVDTFIARMEPSAAEAVRKGIEHAVDITDTQFAQFMAHCSAVLFNAEDGFYQHSEGLLNEVAFKNLKKALNQYWAVPGMHMAWKILRGMFGHEFVAFMDKLMSEVPIGRQMDQVSVWRAGIAAETALSPP